MKVDVRIVVMWRPQVLTGQSGYVTGCDNIYHMVEPTCKTAIELMHVISFYQQITNAHTHTSLGLSNPFSQEFCAQNV
jgi:hypothetical protein